jgi:hypothetical protein
MKRLPFRVVATVSSRADADAFLRRDGDAVLVKRGVDRLLVFRCPDGCGEILPVNLDRRAGMAWSLYEKDGRCSLFPSVWRDTGCQSHFVVWANRVFLFGKFDPNEESWLSEMEVDCDVVLEQLSGERFVPFEQLADDLGWLPWDVLGCCRNLQRRGRVEEGKGDLKGAFRLLGRS